MLLMKNLIIIYYVMHMNTVGQEYNYMALQSVFYSDTTDLSIKEKPSCLTKLNACSCRVRTRYKMWRPVASGAPQAAHVHVR